MDRATLSTLLGFSSIAAWLCAQIPQLFENWKNSSVEGLALPFLVSWLFGDLTNLIGCLLTKQLPFQTYLASYFVLVDVGLMSQWIYYSNKTPSIPPLNASNPHLYNHPHTPRGSHIRASREASRRDQSRYRKLTRVPSSTQKRSQSREAILRGSRRDSDRPMMRSWMSEVSRPGSRPASRPATLYQSPIEYQSNTAQPSSSTASSAHHSDALDTPTLSIISLPAERRGRTLARPHFTSDLDTINGSPANQSPFLTHQQQPNSHSPSFPHQTGSTRSRSRIPTARRSTSMVFLSVGLLFGFGHWSTTSQSGLLRRNEVQSSAWSTGALMKEKMKELQHPISTLVRRQIFPLALSIPPTAQSITSSEDGLSRGEETLPGNDEEDEEPYPGPDYERIFGRASAWLCTTLYLTSRMPQLWKNFRRRSVEGLSMLLFVMAFVGNSLYVLSILTNPLATSPGYLLESTPYLLGSGGTLCFDFAIVIQSYLYSDKRRERLERDKRRIGKANMDLDVEEAAALLHHDEDDQTEFGEGEDDTATQGTLTGRSSRNVSRSVSRNQSRTGRRSIEARRMVRSSSTQLSGMVNPVHSVHRSAPSSDDGGETFEFDDDRTRSRSRTRASDSRTRTSNVSNASLHILAEESESSVTLRL